MFVVRQKKDNVFVTVVAFVHYRALSDKDVDAFYNLSNTKQQVQAYVSMVVAIATTALEGFNNEAKSMVTALVDMERVFVPPQHFIRLVQRRMDRQRREEEIKTKSSLKAVDAAQSLLNRASSPQTGGNLKSVKDFKRREVQGHSIPVVLVENSSRFFQMELHGFLT